MHVEELGAAFIDALAQAVVGLVGSAKTNGVGLGQRPVKGFASRGACEDADLERLAFGVKLRGSLRDGKRSVFWRSGGGEPAEGYILIIFNQLGCFRSR